jgi:hypothetical protein
MEVLPIGIPWSYKCMVSVHAKSNVPCVAIKDLPWDSQPLCCVNVPVIPLGEHRVVEGCVL